MDAIIRPYVYLFSLFVFLFILWILIFIALSDVAKVKPNQFDQFEWNDIHGNLERKKKAIDRLQGVKISVLFE